MINDASKSSNQDSVCSFSLSSFSFSSFSFCEFESDLSGLRWIHHLPCILTSRLREICIVSVRHCDTSEPAPKMLLNAIEIASFASFANYPSVSKFRGFYSSLQVSHGWLCTPHPAKTSLGCPNFQPKADGFVTCPSQCLHVSKLGQVLLWMVEKSCST